MASMRLPFSWAYLPHSMNTTPLRSLLMTRTACVVNSSQPFLLWLAALWASTVRTEFNIKTPWWAQGSRHPFSLGIEQPTSSEISL